MIISCSRASNSTTQLKKCVWGWICIRNIPKWKFLFFYLYHSHNPISTALPNWHGHKTWSNQAKILARGRGGRPFGKNSHKIPFRTHWLSTLRSYFHLWKPVLQFTGKVLGKNIGDKSSTEKSIMQDYVLSLPFLVRSSIFFTLITNRAVWGKLKTAKN